MSCNRPRRRRCRPPGSRRPCGRCRWRDAPPRCRSPRATADRIRGRPPCRPAWWPPAPAAGGPARPAPWSRPTERRHCRRRRLEFLASPSSFAAWARPSASATERGKFGRRLRGGTCAAILCENTSIGISSRTAPVRPVWAMFRARCKTSGNSLASSTRHTRLQMGRKISLCEASACKRIL